jgi:hypothetical protein
MFSIQEHEEDIVNGLKSKGFKCIMLNRSDITNLDLWSSYKILHEVEGVPFDIYDINSLCYEDIVNSISHTMIQKDKVIVLVMLDHCEILKTSFDFTELSTDDMLGKWVKLTNPETGETTSKWGTNSTKYSYKMRLCYV